jgi:hypothetical protein
MALKAYPFPPRRELLFPTPNIFGSMSRKPQRLRLLHKSADTKVCSHVLSGKE